MRRAIVILTPLALLGAASSASAAVTICSGGECVPDPISNVLVDGGATGTTVTGTLNNAPGVVSFTSPEQLINQANGQARIRAFDGTLQSTLTIALAGRLINALEFNVRALTSGTMTLSFAGGNSNGQISAPLALSANGQNFYNVYNGTFDSVTFAFADGATVEDIRQVRLTATAAVPEPSTWALMLIGFFAIGAAVRRRKPVVSTTVSYA
jgi:PEP-CTERM motif